MVTNDRRQFQRLRLAKPILAMLDGSNALILEIGISGAFVEHYGEARQNQKFQLLFRWQGQDVEFTSSVVRSETIRPAAGGKPAVSHSAMQFVDSKEKSFEHLQDMIATFVGRMLAAQKANAAGNPDIENARVLDQIGSARRSRSQGYITYRRKGNVWMRMPTDSATQPPDGFTVAAHEDEDELKALCQAYESSDGEGRRLIRLVAELSARSVAKS